MEALIAAVNSMQGLYNMALALATRAHEGQVDHAGAPYILHPIRVAERCRTMEAKIVALLHDTIEDTDLTPDFLLQQGFPTSNAHTQTGILLSYQLLDMPQTVVTTIAAIGLQTELTDRDVARTRKYLHAWHYLQDPISLPDR